MFGERVSVIGGTGVLDERTTILDGFFTGHVILYRLCLRYKTTTNIKKTILRKGGGPDPEPEHKLLLGNESEFCPHESDSDRSSTLALKG
jgi:hypothetical protein